MGAARSAVARGSRGVAEHSRCCPAARISTPAPRVSACLTLQPPGTHPILLVAAAAAAATAATSATTLVASTATAAAAAAAAAATALVASPTAAAAALVASPAAAAAALVAASAAAAAPAAAPATTLVAATAATASAAVPPGALQGEGWACIKEQHGWRAQPSSNARKAADAGRPHLRTTAPAAPAAAPATIVASARHPAARGGQGRGAGLRRLGPRWGRPAGLWQAWLLPLGQPKANPRA